MSPSSAEIVIYKYSLTRCGQCADENAGVILFAPLGLSLTQQTSGGFPPRCLGMQDNASISLARPSLPAFHAFMLGIN